MNIILEEQTKQLGLGYPLMLASTIYHLQWIYIPLMVLQILGQLLLFGIDIQETFYLLSYSLSTLFSWLEMFYMGHASCFSFKYCGLVVFYLS